jgi:hypothetical protein
MMIRMMIVIRMIAMAMLPVSLSRTTRRTKKAWKIGVNSQARKLNGSVGWTGVSGIAAGGVGVTGAPLAPGDPPAGGAGVSRSPQSV